MTVRTYDELNRVITKYVPEVGVMTYEYDITTGVADGHVAEISTDPKGNVVTNTYDELGRIKTVETLTNITTNSYDANGNKDYIEYSDGGKENYEYYDNNQLKSIIHTKADASALATFSYTYDNAGNQISKTNSKGTTYYNYDCLNRLEKVVEPGKTTNYLYDSAGNRIKETITEAISTTEIIYTYNEQNRLMQTESKTDTGSIETTKYTYDLNGNLTYSTKEVKSLASPDNKPSFGLFIVGQTDPEINEIAGYETTYKYDKFNQLIKVSSGATISEYVYNGEGRRVVKTVNGEPTTYVYEADKVILELNDDGTQLASNVYGNNRLISRTSGTETAYYFYNGHGDVTSLLDKNGTTMATYIYDAFGNPIEETGDTDNPYRYAGYQYDEESGLYYLNSRMYDPSIARFLQEDTYRGKTNDPLSLNLYSYCYNNPIKYWDPTGHIVTEWDKANLSKEDQDEIDRLTEEWEKANANGDDAAKKKAHDDAEAIRNKARNGEIGSDDGYTYVETSKTSDKKTYEKYHKDKKDTDDIIPIPNELQGDPVWETYYSNMNSIHNSEQIAEQIVNDYPGASTVMVYGPPTFIGFGLGTLSGAILSLSSLGVSAYDAEVDSKITKKVIEMNVVSGLSQSNNGLATYKGLSIIGNSIKDFAKKAAKKAADIFKDSAPIIKELNDARSLPESMPIKMPFIIPQLPFIIGL